jgi:hypothetical protein
VDFAVSEVLTAVKMSMLVFQVVTGDGGTAICSSESLVSTYESIWRCYPEEHHGYFESVWHVTAKHSASKSYEEVEGEVHAFVTLPLGARD